MRKQQSHEHQTSKQLHGKQSYKKQAAVAATLVAGGMSALLVTALPASADTSYRDALDRCVAAPAGNDTFDECVEKIEALKPAVVAAKPVSSTPAPAAPTSAPPKPDEAAAGLAGTVTSGADQIVAAPTESAAAIVEDLPDGPTLQNRIQAKAVEQVRALDSSVGNEVAKPASEEAAPAAPAAERQSTTEAAPVDDWMSDTLARLRQCESTNNYGANTGNGYYGAYQFSTRTWNSLGFEGYPHQASPEVQDRAAIALQARDGWGQWPACARRLDLL